MRIVVILVIVASLVICVTSVQGEQVSRISVPLQTELPRPAPIDRGDRNAYFEGFESGVPPADWTRIKLLPTDEDCWISTDTAHSGLAGALAERLDSGHVDEIIWTPMLDFSDLSNPKLSLWQYGYLFNVFWAQHHQILVSLTPPERDTVFTVIVDWTWDDNEETNYTWTESIIELGMLAGEPQVWLGLRMYDDYSSGGFWYVDDFTIFDPVASDAAVTALEPLDLHLTAGEDLVPTVTVKNLGLDSATFDVLVEVVESGTTVLSETLTIADLEHWGEVTLVTTSIPVQAGQYYELSAVALLDGDQQPANDARSGFCESWTGPHVPAGFLFTNAGCVPCVAANQELDEYMSTAGNSVAVARIHVWWPDPNDPMFLANPEQIEALAVDYLVGGVPSGHADGRRIDIQHATDLPERLEQEKSRGSAMTVTPVGWNAATEVLTVIMHIHEPVPDRGFRLLGAVTEDGIVYDGGNGELEHQQVLRRFYPDNDGVLIDVMPGSHTYEIAMPLEADWVYENLRASVFVQLPENGFIYESGSAFLQSIAGPTAADGAEMPTRQGTMLAGARPNPFNPATAITFALARQQRVRVSVYTVTGRRLAVLVDGELPAGDHSLNWNGTDHSGQQIASGTYLIHLESEDGMETSKMSLVR